MFSFSMIDYVQVSDVEIRAFTRIGRKPLGMVGRRPGAEGYLFYARNPDGERGGTFGRRDDLEEAKQALEQATQ